MLRPDFSLVIWMIPILQQSLSGTLRGKAQSLLGLWVAISAFARVRVLVIRPRDSSPSPSPERGGLV